MNKNFDDGRLVVFIVIMINPWSVGRHTQVVTILFILYLVRIIRQRGLMSQQSRYHVMSLVIVCVYIRTRLDCRVWAFVLDGFRQWTDGLLLKRLVRYWHMI